MAVSGSRDFILNRDQICTSALRKLKVVIPGQTPSTDIITYAAEALNIMQLSWQNEGIFLWTNTDKHLAITADTANITASSTADTIEINNLYYRENECDNTPLTKMSLSEYREITDKTVSGTPTHYYVDYLLESTVIYLFPVYSHTTGVITGSDANTYLAKNDHTSAAATYPTTGADYANDWEATTQLTTGGAWVTATAYYSGHIRCTKIQRLQDFDAAANNPDFHARAYKALVDGLAAELAPEYRTWREVPYYQKRAQESFKSFLFGQSETGSIRIQPRIR